MQYNNKQCHVHGVSYREGTGQVFTPAGKLLDLYMLSGGELYIIYHMIYIYIIYLAFLMYIVAYIIIYTPPCCMMHAV